MIRAFILSERAVVATVLFWALAGCAVGPTYSGPPQAAASSWQAPLPHGGQVGGLTDWWSQFHDPALSQLIAWAEADSPTLTQAWASIQKARATLIQDRAGGLPSLTGTGNASRSKQLTGTQSAITRMASAGLDASWEIDLMGRIRRMSEASSARVEARQADWHEARISLAAEVADTYVQYRACGLLAQLYEREWQSLAATERATAAMVQAGLSAPSDGALARANLASGRSTLLRQQADCAIQVKALVYLTGQEEASLRDQLAGSSVIPQPAELSVDRLPADVVRQRPDVVSLERELAATSSEIGAAQADLYPSFSLTGSISRNSLSGGGGYSAWSFGPSLSLPLLDGGKRRAAVDTATASHASALAAYRLGVRAAVREVEESLVNLHSSGERATQALHAAEEYRRYLSAADMSWRAGTTSLLSLEEARRAALSADMEVLTLAQSRVSQWIALYKALGGGWSPDAATPAETTSVRSSEPAPTPSTAPPTPTAATRVGAASRTSSPIEIHTGAQP
ncbi:efflux transporter outer membrane subunit [Roseateles amylovorans]|uniref:Efflux transporter outer membrane subunit n=1 Tax=Roseateles amylovorans TaxID=2978473 RepID=A0ABY6AWB5_9BURK|nr:efflux transporter outer membrane subunit [Roseateles amylovorans]UXH77228.1 efflux transporter outer membrane subunit [Roseateles amylovorans]